MAECLCGFNDAPGGATGSQLLVAHGPTLRVNIGFDKTYKLASKTPPIPGMKDINALVDTGAAESCIDNQLAKELNLPVVDKTNIAGVGGKHTVNVYLAQVHIPTLPFTIYGSFAGVDLAAGGQIHRALIGRTFLRNFKMIYEGKTGTVKITSL